MLTLAALRFFLPNHETHSIYTQNQHQKHHQNTSAAAACLRLQEAISVGDPAVAQRQGSDGSSAPSQQGVLAESLEASAGSHGGMAFISPFVLFEVFFWGGMFCYVLFFLFASCCCCQDQKTIGPLSIYVC